MTTTSRAAEALTAVLSGVFPPSEDNGQLRVLNSWTEDDEVICVVYQGWWFEGLLGLRRRIDDDLPLDVVVLQIVASELGEPVGRMVEGVEPDSDGITWWEGEPREWWPRY